jgi:hypothetical protein
MLGSSMLSTKRMVRVLVTDEERAFIEQRVGRYADESPTKLHWQLPHVRAHGALPLYIGWTETRGVVQETLVFRRRQRLLADMLSELDAEHGSISEALIMKYEGLLR